MKYSYPYANGKARYNLITSLMFHINNNLSCNVALTKATYF